MISINSAQVTPTLRALFRMDEPQAKRCFKVLDGTSHAGKIFCDDPANPTWGVVVEPSDNSLYFGGNVTTPIVAEVFDALRQEVDVLVGLWLDDPRLELLPPNPDYDGRTLEFYNRPVGEGLDQFASRRLPSPSAQPRSDPANRVGAERCRDMGRPRYVGKTVFWLLCDAG